MLFIFTEQELLEHNAVVTRQQARIAELDAARQVVWQDRVPLRPEYIRVALEWAYRMGATYGDRTPAELWWYEAEEDGAIARHLPNLAVSIPAPAGEASNAAEFGETPVQAGVATMERLKLSDSPTVAPIEPVAYMVDVPSDADGSSSTQFLTSLEDAQRAPAGSIITALYGAPVASPAACGHCRGSGIDWSVN